MCSRKMSEKRYQKWLFILIYMPSVLFSPDRFGCPMTHLQFNLSFMEKFQSLSAPAKANSKTQVLRQNYILLFKTDDLI